MKALMVTARGVLDVRELPMPEPGPYDALCRTTFGAICAGTDTHVIDGTFGPDRYPAIIGHETIGEVIVVGSAVTAYAPGDLVTRVAVPPSPNGEYELAWGGMAEYAVARDHRALARDGHAESSWRAARVNQVIRTRRLPARQMPIFITWRETYSYTRRLGVVPGCRVLISGSGANGLAIAAMAPLLGAAEVALVGSPHRLSEAGRAGASVAVSYTQEAAVGDLVDEWRASVDILVDATGIRHSLDRLLPAIANDGIVGVYGLDDAGKYAIDPTRAPSFRFLDPGYEEAEAHDAIEQAIDDGLLDAGIWIDEDSTFGWGTIRDAYGAARDRSLIKPVIDLRSPL